MKNITSIGSSGGDGDRVLHRDFKRLEISIANGIRGSSTGSQRRLIRSRIRPYPATASAAERHARQKPTPWGDTSKVPPRTTGRGGGAARPGRRPVPPGYSPWTDQLPAPPLTQPSAPPGRSSGNQPHASMLNVKACHASSGPRRPAASDRTRRLRVPPAPWPEDRPWR